MIYEMLLFLDLVKHLLKDNPILDVDNWNVEL